MPQDQSRPVEELSIDQIRRRRLDDTYAAFTAIELTERQYLAVTLAYKQGLRRQEMAKRMGISVTAVSSLLARAKQRRATYDRKLRQERYVVMRDSM